MRSKLLVRFIFIICLMSISACESGNTTYSNINKLENKEVETTIKNNLDIIVTNKNVSLSSNPNDYIKTNQKRYEEIISTGEPGLTYLVNRIKKSQENGLREWIMAKACNDILKGKNLNFEWNTGKEWLNNYEKNIK